jgi:hypothetical protein
VFAKSLRPDKASSKFRPDGGARGNFGAYQKVRNTCMASRDRQGRPAGGMCRSHKSLKAIKLCYHIFLI